MAETIPPYENVTKDQAEATLNARIAELQRRARNNAAAHQAQAAPSIQNQAEAEEPKAEEPKAEEPTPINGEGALIQLCFALRIKYQNPNQAGSAIMEQIGNLQNQIADLTSQLRQALSPAVTF
jgi:hypothetical protein